MYTIVIFVINVFLPPPINYLLIVVQAVLLALSTLFIGKAGATYVGAVGGVLTALGRPALGPFTFFFAFLYGFLVDVSVFIFKITASPEGVNRNRLMAAMAFSTVLIGFLSYYGTVLIPKFLQSDPAIDMLVMFMGPITGAVAGYAASYLWNKYLRNINV